MHVWQVVITEQYQRRVRRFLDQHPELAPRYAKTLVLLEADPHHPGLRLHALKGALTGMHSISINLSYRITLEFEIRGRKIVLVNVGTHEELYR